MAQRLFENADDIKRALISKSIENNDQREAFHHIFFAVRLLSFKADHMLSSPMIAYKVPTDTLKQIMFQVYHKMALENRQMLLAKFVTIPQLAWLVFESHIVDILTTGSDPLPISFLDATLTATLPHRSILRRTPFDPSDSSPLVPNEVYVPLPGYASVDAFVRVKEGLADNLYLIQSTLAKKHPVSTKGILPIRNKCPEANCYFVFAVPSEANGQTLATRLGGSIKIGRRRATDRNRSWLDSDINRQCDFTRSHGMKTPLSVIRRLITILIQDILDETSQETNVDEDTVMKTDT